MVDIDSSPDNPRRNRGALIGNVPGVRLEVANDPAAYSLTYLRVDIRRPVDREESTPLHGTATRDLRYASRVTVVFEGDGMPPNRNDLHVEVDPGVERVLRLPTGFALQPERLAEV